MSRGTYLLTHSSSSLFSLSAKKNKASFRFRMMLSEKALFFFERSESGDTSPDSSLFQSVRASICSIISLSFMPSASDIFHSVSIFGLIRPLSIIARWLRGMLASPDSTSCVNPFFVRSSRTTIPVILLSYRIVFSFPCLWAKVSTIRAVFFANSGRNV